MLSSAPDKAKLFAKNFSKNYNLDDSSISLPVFVFHISNMVLGLLDQLQIFWKLYLIELLELVTGLGLLEL